jgi:Tfp pilus assembly protein PilN
VVLRKQNEKKWWLAVKAGSLVLAAMIVYEVIKQSVWSNLSLWESHLITIAFSAICSVLAAYFVAERQQRMLNELEARNADNERLRMEVEHTLSRLQETRITLDTLTSLLPMCAWCKSIRDDDGNWSSIEHYMTTKTQTKLTHGICPQCEERLENSGRHRP